MRGWCEVRAAGVGSSLRGWSAALWRTRASKGSWASPALCCAHVGPCVRNPEGEGSVLVFVWCSVVSKMFLLFIVSQYRNSFVLFCFV